MVYNRSIPCGSKTKIKRCMVSGFFVVAFVFIYIPLLLFIIFTIYKNYTYHTPIGVASYSHKGFNWCMVCEKLYTNYAPTLHLYKPGTLKLKSLYSFLSITPLYCNVLHATLLLKGNAPFYSFFSKTF